MEKLQRACLLVGMLAVVAWLLFAARFPLKCHEGFCETRSEGWAWWER